jgi:NADPH:quinone reductase-like Zn-dependent oxidoreductase
MNATPAALPIVDAPSVAHVAHPMRAIVQSAYGGTDVLQLGTIERPKAGEGEVVVEVRAAALDRGTWHLMTGRPYMMRLFGFGFFRPKQPIAGRDLSGVVAEVGPGVQGFRVGDAVFGIGEGTFAEHARARADKLAHKPRSLSFEQAAVSGVSAVTALRALRDEGRLARGERVLIVGASGGVGTFAVQLAKAFGAEVTGVCSSSKVDLVRSIGADRVIDYTREDFADGSAQYDLVIDVGGNTPLRRLRRAMTPTGRLVFVGGENGGDFAAGFERQLLAFMLAPFVKQRFAMLMVEETAADLETVAALADEGAFTPVIDRRCALDAVVGAMRDLEAGKVKGKVVVVP